MTMLDAFNALGIGGKILVIFGHLLAVALVTLFALFLEKRDKDKALSKTARQGIKYAKSTPKRERKEENMKKPVNKATVWGYLLSNITNPIKKIPFYNPPHNQGNNQNNDGLRSHSGDNYDREKE